MPTLISLYDSAISQSNHEGDLIWQKFNGFIVTHAIFFALISGIITTENLNYQNIYLIILSVAGFFLGLLWLISTIRGYEALHYWQNSAIEIACRLLN